MTTVGPTQAAAWTAADLRSWRSRLRWTQARAAEAVVYHLEAYKKLECGTRPVGNRVKRLCLLTEREHLRSLFSTSAPTGGRQIFATADNVLARLEALRRDGRLTDRNGRPRIKYASLFSGIEGASAALERIGSNALPVLFAETDPAANAVLRYRWPDVPRTGDVTEFDWSTLLGKIDLIIGGSPCQSFSVAGRRLGLSDPRGNLALHFLRAVGAMQPRWFLYENVPGLLSADGGDAFGTFLESVEELGYACSWRILDAKFFGLPQRRRRLWVVGERGASGCGPSEVLALHESEKGRARPRRAAWKTPAGRIERSFEGLTPEENIDWSEAAAWLSAPTQRALPDHAEDDANQARNTLYAADLRHCTVGREAMTVQCGPLNGWSLNATPCVIVQNANQTTIRRFSPAECLRLQGFDDDWLVGAKLAGKTLTDSECYRLIGNAFAVPMAAWVMERLIQSAGGCQSRGFRDR